MNEWDSYWDSGHSRLGDSFLNDARDKALSLMAGRGIKTVLDVGCGSGDTLEALHNAGYLATGIDNSKKAVKMCKKRGLDALEDNAYCTRFRNGEFDAVFSEGLLEHFSDFMPILSEMSRISSRFIVLIQPNHFSAFHKLAGIYYALKPAVRVKELTYSLEDYDRSLASFGFSKLGESSARLGSFWIIIYAKVKP